MVSLFATLTGCSNNLVDQVNKEESGIITASVNLPTSSNTTASVDSFSDLQPGAFIFTLNDSNGDEYGTQTITPDPQTVESPEVVFDKVEPGNYTIKVIVKDSDD